MSNTNHSTPVQRFVARTSREALGLVRHALGEDAVIVSTGPSPGGVEVLAMSAADSASLVRPAAEHRGEDGGRASEPVAADSVQSDVKTLQMSTLSFQDYVRNRMLRRRKQTTMVRPGAEDATLSTFGHHVDMQVGDDGQTLADVLAARAAQSAVPPVSPAAARAVAAPAFAAPAATPPAPPVAPAESVRAAVPAPATRAPEPVPAAPVQPFIDSRATGEMLDELRSVRGLIEERFGVLAFLGRLERRPAAARLSARLIDCGFSPALVRKLAEGLPAELDDETAWTSQVLERNLRAADRPGPDEAGGIHALIGPTGVGKTTTTAKLAAAFAARHGVAGLGLVTLDAYRVGAQEQLRAYGRILGVPVHTAHDRASLEDLLDLLSAKKLVLIDTAGMAQRDARTRELLEMISHREISKLLVVSAAAQAETIEDTLFAYRASGAAGLALTKIDEAVKLGPALDAAIRHRLSIVGVANGQRVPEDWHRLSAQALVHRALRAVGNSAWRLDPADIGLVFAEPQSSSRSGGIGSGFGASIGASIGAAGGALEAHA
jgi:flagellar biosynthesis protein FlhF